MKSFTVTKDMRTNIGQKLTAKAIEAEMKAINSEAESINKAFWKSYKKRLRAVSGIPSTQWDKLIEIGMAIHTYALSPEDEDGEAIAVVQRSRQTNEDLEQALSREIRNELWRHFSRRNFSRDWELTFKAGHSLPRHNKATLVEDEDLISRIKAICERQQALTKTILEFHRKTMMVLSSCRTAKQMRDLFPEGAKLLPKPVERTTDLAPKELAESVTKMIQQGVPPVQ